jgi:dTDP-4-dehydrorhamnose 3,5-epimerase
MKFVKTHIPDVIIIEPNVFEDERGFFMEFYRKNVFSENGIEYDFKQDNHSYSKKGVLRGIHYQLEPYSQGKLVRCIRGRVFDVAVDLRIGSPWFKRYVAVELSAENKKMIWIPPGFGHAFLALEDSEIIYKVTEIYNPSAERGIRWDDPEISIDWPIKNPILSQKDKNFPFLKDAEINFFYSSGPK